MSLRPLADRVVITKLEEEKKTSGGIIIPDTATEKPLNGVVISVGTKVSELKEGDKVVFGKYAGTEVKVEGTTYLVMKEEEVLAVL